MIFHTKQYINKCDNFVLGEKHCNIISQPLYEYKLNWLDYAIKQEATFKLILHSLSLFYNKDNCMINGKVAAMTPE